MTGNGRKKKGLINMYQRRCRKCGSHSLFTEQHGNNTGLYCSDCGAWQTWLGKDELHAFEHSQNERKNQSEYASSDSEIEAIHKINDSYGQEVQERQTIEEMSELTKALNKLWRFDKNVLHNKKSKEELLANVYEEHADVSICLQYLIEIYGCKEEVKKIRLEKFERELQRIQRNAE